MNITNFPNGISSFGVPVIGSGATIPFTTGTYRFVDSSTGVNLSDNRTKTRPYATIDYAIGQCTASAGDVIIVFPGHTETITAAAGIALDVAGVSIVSYQHLLL